MTEITRSGSGFRVRPSVTETDNLAPWDRLLLRLPGKYRRTGDGKWMAQCPAHLDKTPSLSIREADDGKLLIHCFAGCTPDDVIASLGLEWLDLFPHDPNWRPAQRSNGSVPRLAVEDSRFILELARASLEAGQTLTDSGARQVREAMIALTAAGEDPGPDLLPPEQRAGVLAWYPADKWVESMTAPDWLIPNYLERGTLNVTVGGWGSGKSVVELDRCLHLSHGLPWQGCTATAPELVVYVIGEAQRGFQRRVAAWHKHHALPPSPLFVAIPEAVLLGERDHEQAMANTLIQIQEHYSRKVSLVVLDTMARCFGPQDESSNSDVGRWVNAVAAYVTAPTGAAVSVLHHPGHANKERGRGASALPGAADSEWLLERTDSIVSMRCNKSKDSEHPEPVAWRLFGVEIEIDGVLVMAPVAEAVPVGTLAPAAQAREGSRQAEALRLLEGIFADARKNLEDQGRPAFEAKVDRKAWWQRAEECGIAKTRNAFNRLVQELINKELIAVNGEWVTIKNSE